MRVTAKLFLAASGLIATALRAQSPVGSAPVVPVTTTAMPPAAAPAAAPTLPTPHIGQPDGGWNLQAAMTPIAAEARHVVMTFIDPIMVGVCIVVFALLLYTLARYRAGRNPVASRTSHNTLVEVVWTVVPVLILVVIAVPSFRLLANQYQPPKAGLTIKATGHQWYWEYEYPDQGGFSFDSIILSDEDAAKKGDPAKLGVDNRVVVPAGVTVRVLTTAADVIHAWAIPSFWVQMDAVPGRVNETWFKVDRPGVYYGQCFQLCGTKHAFMPIAVEVVPPARFAAWVAAKQKENGITPKTAAASAGSLTSTAAPAANAAAEVKTGVTPAVPTVTAPPAPAAPDASPATAPAPAATK
ncbi:MAG: cytochrome c oxidase subunit II [Sphingomonadaceae bacterium]|nr:cytochrome c oxidase subunit II [Sphingomonadaceae bacterium]